MNRLAHVIDLAHGVPLFYVTGGLPQRRASFGMMTRTQGVWLLLSEGEGVRRRQQQAPSTEGMPSYEAPVADLEDEVWAEFTREMFEQELELSRIRKEITKRKRKATTARRA